jgi:hypothetical protein
MPLVYTIGFRPFLHASTRATNKKIPMYCQQGHLFKSWYSITKIEPHFLAPMKVYFEANGLFNEISFRNIKYMTAIIKAPFFCRSAYALLLKVANNLVNYTEHKLISVSFLLQSQYKVSPLIFQNVIAGVLN